MFEGTLRSVTRFQESRAGVTVGPWTFLASAQIHPYAKIVWPREGAFVLPIWLGFKKRLDTMGHLIEDYFFSERYAALSARAGVPTCVSTKDPQSMRLLAQMGPHAPGWYAWPGWKALKEMDIQQLHKLQEGIAEP